MRDADTASPIAALDGTWPPTTTWRGRTGSILQAGYVAWMISATFVSLSHWLLLGVLVIVLVAAREALFGGLHVHQQEWGRPTVYFLHRNVCLHTMALIAAIGADHPGALVLLLWGAGLDLYREVRIRRARWRTKKRGLFRIAVSKPRSGSRYFFEPTEAQFVLLAGVVAILLVWVASPKAGVVVQLDRAVGALAHLQQSMVRFSRVLELREGADAAIRFRLTIGVCTVLFLYFVSGQQRAVMERFLLDAGRKWRIENPILLSLAVSVLLGDLYAFVTFYGTEVMIGYGFGFGTALGFLCLYFLMSAVQVAYLGRLTELRAKAGR